MATIHKCDKCDKVIKSTDKGLDVSIYDYGNTLNANAKFPYYYCSYNLCKKCANSLSKNIKKLFPIKKSKN